MATITKAELKLYIYTGSKGEKPATPQYTLVKDRLASSNEDTNEDIIVFEISELVKDYVDVNFTGDYSNIEQNAWVEAVITRTFDNDTTDIIDKTMIAFLGYGEFEDGINPALSLGYLISNQTIFVLEGEPSNVPFYQSAEQTSINKVEYFKGASLLASRVINTNVASITVDSSSIKASSGNIRADATQKRTFNSSGFTSQDEIPQQTTKINTTLLDGTVESRFVRAVSECKRTPYRVSFINRFGVIQDLWFFKRRDDSFDVQREDFKRSILDIGTSSVSYNAYKGSRQALDISAKEKLVMNTGYITEDHNEVIKQLMVTEHCWVHQNSTLTPLKPTTTSFQEKKEVDEKLLNFTVEFEVANNYIQDIR